MSVSARPGARSKEARRAGASPASACAGGASRRPLVGHRRPSRAISRRSIAAARSYSISCSQIAHASASNGSGRAPTRTVGFRRSARPISGSSRNARWNGARSWSMPSARRIRPIPCSAPVRVRAVAPNSTASAAVCATRTCTRSPSWWSRRCTTPERTRVRPSSVPWRGRRNGQRGRTSTRISSELNRAGGRSRGPGRSAGCRRPAAAGGARRASAPGSRRALRRCSSASVAAPATKPVAATAAAWTAGGTSAGGAGAGAGAISRTSAITGSPSTTSSSGSSGHCRSSTRSWCHRGRRSTRGL